MTYINIYREHCPNQFQWRIVSIFERKYDFNFTFHFFFDAACLRESIGVSPSLYCFTYIVHVHLLRMRNFRKVLFFFYICMYGKNLFVFAPFYLLKLKNKICFLLALIKLCLTFNTPQAFKISTQYIQWPAITIKLEGENLKGILHTADFSRGKRLQAWRYIYWFNFLITSKIYTMCLWKSTTSVLYSRFPLVCVCVGEGALKRRLPYICIWHK